MSQGRGAALTIAQQDPRDDSPFSSKRQKDEWIIPPLGLDTGDEQRRHEAEMDELQRATERRKQNKLLDERELPSDILVSELRRERKNSILCNQFVLYLPFLLLFIFFFLIGRPIEPSFWINSQISGNLLTNQFSTKFGITNWSKLPNEIDGYYVERTIEHITKVDDIHVWLESVVLPAFWTQLNPDATRPVGGIAVGVNLLIGSLRLRTINNRGLSCGLNFDTISSSIDALRLIDTMVPIFDVGAGGCYDLYRYGNSVNHSDMYALGDDASTGASFSFVGCESGDRLYGDLPKTYYSCEGNVFDIPFSSSYNQALARFQLVRNAANGGQGLISEKLISTRLFNLQLFSFTPEAKIYMFSEATIEVSTGGSLITSFRARPFEVYLGDSLYTASSIYFAFFAAFSLCCFLVFLVDKVHVVWYERLLNIFTFWNILELANFAVLFATFAVHIAWTIESVEKRSRLHIAIPDNNPRSYGNAYPVELERICLLYTIKSTLNAFNIVVIFLLCIKYAARWSSISRAIAAARSDLVGILVIFALIVTAYALSGVILFGHGMDQYSSMERSLSTTMRILVGDFDYETMRLVNPVLAAVYFWSYNILAIFLMLNFFVGALKNAYGDERKRLEESTASQGGESPSLLFQKTVDALHVFVKDLRNNPKLTIQLLILNQKNRFFEHRDMYTLILAINTIRYKLLVAEHNGRWPFPDERNDNLFLENIDGLVGAPKVSKQTILKMVDELFGTGSVETDRAHNMLNHFWPQWAQVVDDMPVGDVSQSELEEAVSKTVTETLERMFGNETWPQHRGDRALSSWSNVLAASEMFLPQEALTNEAQKAHAALQRLEEALLLNARTIAVAKQRYADQGSPGFLSPQQSVSH